MAAAVIGNPDSAGSLPVFLIPLSTSLVLLIWAIWNRPIWIEVLGNVNLVLGAIWVIAALIGPRGESLLQGLVVTGIALLTGSLMRFWVKDLRLQSET